MVKNIKIVLCTALLSVCFMFNTMAGVKFSDPEKPVLVTKKAPVFSITLQSNRTTGFQWLLAKYNASLIKPVSQKYYPPKNAIPGAGGYEIWNFQVKPLGFAVPRVTAIALIYARPWDLRGSKSIIFKVITNDS